MCKRSQKQHGELAKKQTRLDSRGNDPEATVRESEFALDLYRGLDEGQVALLSDHLTGLGSGPSGKAFKTELDKLSVDDRKDPMKLGELMLDKKSGFKTMLDNHVNLLTIEQPYKGMKEKSRALPIFQQRGRDDNRPRVRRGSFTNPDAGIVSGENRTGELRGVFSKDLDHAKGAITQKRDETLQKFRDQGAPFIGGASGTIQLLCIDLEKRKPRKDLSKEELADRERLLAIHMTSLVVGGHHSMAETLLAAQAMGYFRKIPDPLVDYDGSMQKLQQHLGSLGMSSGKPLSKRTEDQGKSREQVAYESARTEVVARWERFSDQLDGFDRRALENALSPCDDQGYVGARWDLAQRDLQGVKNRVELAIQTALAQRTGNAKVLTGAELANKFGRPPGKKSGDRAYSGIVAELDKHEQAYKELGGRSLVHSGAEQGLMDLQESLDKALLAARAHLQKFGGSKKDVDQRGVRAVQGAVAQLEKEKAAIDRLLPQLEAVKAKFGERLTLDTALQFCRLDIDICEFADLDTLDPEKVTSSEVLGKGAVNTVYEVHYADPPNPEVVRVVKPEPDREELKKAAQTIGLDGEKPGYGKRNIASKKAANALDLGHLMPDVSFTLQDGKVGLAMSKAPGKTGYAKVWADVPDYNVGTRTDEELKALGYRKNGTSGKWEEKVRGFHDIPFEDPPEVAAKVQQSLMELQWLDGICGQADRHAENYLMDIGKDGSVRLTGIDNDFSFGKQHKQVDKATVNVLGTDHEVDITKGYVGEGFCGKAPIIPKALYDKLTGLSWTDFEKSLSKLMTDEEKEATKLRFEESKQHAQSLHPAFVVTDFVKWRSPDDQTVAEFLKSRPGANYFKRDLALQVDARSKGRVVPLG